MSNLRGASCLITGGAGYIGTSLLRELVQVAGRVRRFSRAESRPPFPVGGSAVLEDVVGDVRVRADVERALEGIDVVFHLAAQTSVYVADADPALDLDTNVLPIVQLLEACRASGRRPTVLFAGTSTQVGLAARWPVDESFPDAPVTVYDVHKIMGEQYLEYYARRSFVRGATFRLANVYGPGPRSSKPERGVLTTMVRRALAGEPLKIFGHGEFVRDYVYVDDVAHAFMLAAENPDAVNGQHFILGTGQGCTLRAAVQRVAEIVGARTGQPVKVEHVEAPASLSPIETRNFVADISAVRRALGWVPRVSLDEGIVRTMEAFLREREPA
jgi:nucleoside-diphosphate-sugar epimerase